MDKVHKYAEKYAEAVIISTNGNSYYYQFNRGKFVLRISDHIGRNSSGKVSIIIENNGYLLHNHNTGAVHIETYENIKKFIKSLATLSSINVQFDMSISEISDLKKRNTHFKATVGITDKEKSKVGREQYTPQ